LKMPQPWRLNAAKYTDSVTSFTHADHSHGNQENLIHQGRDNHFALRKLLALLCIDLFME